MLNNLVSLSQQQLAISGRISQEQVQGMGAALGMVQSAGIDPAIAASTISGMSEAMQGNPGGGPGGEAFIQRVLGLHGSNLEAYREEARRRGINPELFKERSVFEMQRFRETVDRATEAQMLSVGAAVEFGGGSEDFQSFMMSTLTRRPMTEVEKSLNAYRQGKFSDASKNAFGQLKDAEGISGVVGAQGTASQFTATGMEMVQQNIQFANQMLEFGGSDAIVTINKTLRTFQTTMGELTSTAVEPTIREMKKLAGVINGSAEAVGAFATAVKEGLIDLSGESGNGSPSPPAEAVE